MNPLRWLRKMGKFIRGGATPIQILLAAILGMMLGLVPGFNMTHVLIILLLLVLNVSIGIALTCFLVAKALLLLLLPLTVHLENLAIVHTPLAWLFRWAGDTPVLALMRLEQPGVSGGIAAAVVLGLLAGIFLAAVVIRIRRLLVKFGDKSERVRKIVAFFPVRMLLWLLFGGQKKPLSQLLSHRAPLLRKWGIVVGLIFAVLVAGGATLAVDYYLAGELASALGKANGAEVNIADADLSILQGRIRLMGIEVTDPAKPTHNRFQAEEMVADFSVRELLTGRVWMDHIVAPGTPEIDIERETPGEVYEAPEPPPSRNPQDLLWQWLQDPEAIKKFFDRLETVREWLEKIRERMKEKQQEPEGPLSEEYLEWLSRNRKEILTRKPTFLVRRLDIEKIRFRKQDTFRVEARNLSSHPEYNDEPMVIRVGDVQLAGTEETFARRMGLFLTLNFQDVDTPHRLDKMVISDVKLGKTIRLSEKSPIDFEEGKLTVTASGTFSAEAMEIPTALLIRDYRFRTRGGRKFMNLDMGVLRDLDSFPVAVTVSGTLSRPVLTINQEATVQAMKDAGILQKLIQGTVGGLLDRLRDRNNEDDSDGESDGDSRQDPDDSQDSDPLQDLRDRIGF